jgi:hypothetical protein
LAFLWADQGASAGDGLGIAPLEGERLYWAHVQGELIGATWAHWTSPTTVTLVPPRLAPSASASTGKELFGALLRSLSADFGRQPCCAVVLLDDADNDDAHSSRDLLRDAGFQPVSTIEFLMATGVRRDPAARVALGRAGADQRESFEQLLRETTWEEDSPQSSAWVRWRRAAGVSLELDDVATMAEGECYFVQYQDRTVGALVLDGEMGSDAAIEIRYLGIRPAERRQGFAVETLVAVRDRAAREARLVIAAVDSRQVWAVRGYHRAGFHPWQHRTLWAATELRAEI